MSILSLMTPHQRLDIAYWFAFFAGQCVFVLKRSAMAVRSKTNPIKTRRAYLYANWDVILIRSVIEFIIIFYPYRHGELDSVFNFVTLGHLPFAFPQSPVFSLALGYLADSTLDWVGTLPRVPEWLRESIPNLQVYSSHTVQSGVDALGTPTTVEKTVTVEKQAEGNAK